MIQRVQSALDNSQMLSGADASFYAHELAEAPLMDSGIDYAIAHQAALDQYGVSPFALYHPDVIRAYATSFSSGFFKFWGIVL